MPWYKCDNCGQAIIFSSAVNLIWISFFLSCSLLKSDRWTNARPSWALSRRKLHCLLGLLSANALLDTNLMKCHKNVVKYCALQLTGGGRTKPTSVISYFQIVPKSFCLGYSCECVNIILLTRNNMPFCYWTRKSLQLFKFYRPKK